MPLSDRRRRAIRRLGVRKLREREQLVLVEGIRAVEEALEGEAEVRFAVVGPHLAASPRGERLLRRLAGLGVPVEDVEEEELEVLGRTETSQGVLLVCREPEAGLEHLAGVRTGLLVLDGVQDPGNVGTLVRTARAFGLAGVVVLEGTADPWSPKVVRASAGAVFRLPVVRAPWARVEVWLEGEGVPVVAAHAEGEDVRALALRAPWALVVGNEGAGVRHDVLARAALRVAVPMPGGADSLNAGVAGAILLYALTAGEQAAEVG